MTRWRVASSLLVAATSVVVVPSGVVRAAEQPYPIVRVPGPEYGEVNVLDMSDNGRKVLVYAFPSTYRVYDRVTGKKATLEMEMPADLSGDGKVVYGQSDASALEREVVGSGQVTTVTAAVPSSAWAVGTVDASASGRYVALSADEPATFRPEVFILDTATDTRVAVSDEFTPSSLYRYTDPSISADGRYTAFTVSCESCNVPTRVYVYDRITDSVELASRGPGDVPSDGTSAASTISSDGRHVAFVSTATNLRSTPMTAKPRYWMTDLDADTTAMVWGSVPTGFTDPQISTNGDRVAFTRDAPTQPFRGGGSAYSGRQLFIWTNGTRQRVSIDRNGKLPNGRVFHIAMSGNGRRIAFVSSATDLVAGSNRNGIFVATVPAL